jgi:hypothetical protein
MSTQALMRRVHLLSPGQDNPKLKKRPESGRYVNAVLYLSPYHTEPKLHKSTCKFATAIYSVELFKPIFIDGDLDNGVTSFIGNRIQLSKSGGNETFQIMQLDGFNRKAHISVSKENIKSMVLQGGCAKVCLNTAGNPTYLKSKLLARAKKTKLLFQNRELFLVNLIEDLVDLSRQARESRSKAAVRLNGTSDLAWEREEFTLREDCCDTIYYLKESSHRRFNKLSSYFRLKSPGYLAKKLAKKSVIELFPNIRFYDYTKDPSRVKQFLKRTEWPKNYYLTFSKSEVNDEIAESVLELGGNVAVVFGIGRSKPLPQQWKNWKVIDGDIHDFRFLDSRSCVVGLRAKGKAKDHNSNFGFVVT